MSDGLSIGAPITLRDERQFEYVSRVEDIGDGFMTVARPADLRAGLDYEEGMAFHVIWTQFTGIHVLPVQLQGAFVEQNLRLWALEIVGDPWIEQRRDYVRVPARSAVTVTVASRPDPHDRVRFDGLLVDISEVATQCELQATSDELERLIGRDVQCAFTLGHSNYVFAGTIMIVRPGTDRTHARIVVQFEISAHQSDSLRKEIFAVQLASRRRDEVDRLK